ncbi:MAG: hypothetical protein HKN73_15905, partial [Gemmatimonadetes bacterium]|nr:hypothetical protein [Gemmatimonadota bacterium]
MERLRQLIHEIHRRSLWQVLGIYVAASVAVLGGAGTLADVFRLPEWFVPLAFALLIVGLPVVLATAFVQEGLPGAGEVSPVPPEPAGRRGEAEGGVGALWKVFTWRNALLGGVGAFALIGVVAVGLAMPSGAEVGAEGPVLSLDDGVTTVVAVLPFLVSGADLADWEEGLADLVSTNLD